MPVWLPVRNKAPTGGYNHAKPHATNMAHAPRRSLVGWLSRQDHSIAISLNKRADLANDPTYSRLAIFDIDNTADGINPKDIFSFGLDGQPNGFRKPVHPAIPLLREFGALFERSVSGGALHAFVLMPQRGTGKRNLRKDDIRTEIFSAGGPPVMVIVTADWILVDGAKTDIPELTHEQWNAILQACSDFPRSKLRSSNSLGHHSWEDDKKDEDRSPAPLWRHRLAVKALAKLPQPHEGERHSVLISRAGKFSRLGVARALFYSSQVLPLVGTGSPGNEFDKNEALNVMAAYDKWFIEPAQHDFMPNNRVSVDFRDRFREPVLRMLVNVAREKAFITYKELALAVGMQSNPVPPELGYLLSEINIDLAQKDLPMLSSVVVLAKGKLPGEGYFRNAWYLLRIPWEATETEQEYFWSQERQRVYESWQGFLEVKKGENKENSEHIAPEMPSDRSGPKAPKIHLPTPLPVVQALRKILQGKGPYAVGESGKSKKLLEMPADQYSELMAHFNEEQATAIHRMEIEVGKFLRAGETKLVIPARESLSERDQEIFSALYSSFNRFRTGKEATFIPRMPEDLAQETIEYQPKEEPEDVSSETNENAVVDGSQQQVEERHLLMQEIQKHVTIIGRLENELQAERVARKSLEQRLFSELDRHRISDLPKGNESNASEDIQRDLRRESQSRKLLEQTVHEEKRTRRRLERAIWDEISVRKRMDRLIIGFGLVLVFFAVASLFEPTLSGRVKDAIHSLLS